MSELKIPAKLIENIKRGQAALVVGTGVGVPSWNELLQTMNASLRERGDEKAADEVALLIKNQSFSRAAAFLGRSLGADACDEILSEVWQTPSEPTQLSKSIAGLALKQVWTTFPGSILEHAMAKHSPKEWPSTKVKTYQKAGEVNPKQRTVLKILGDYQSYVATPASIRRALADAETLKELVRPFYAQGSLVFVGFDFNDPDFTALLERVFGAFPLPQSHHYWVTSSPDVITVDELAAEHHIQCISLDASSKEEAVVSFVDALSTELSGAGISMSESKPDANDLEGWLGVLATDSSNAEALDAFSKMEEQAKTSQDFDRWVEILMAQIEIEEHAEARADLLWQVASVFNEHLKDGKSALTAASTALSENPAQVDRLNNIESLAQKNNGWNELISDVAGFVSDIEDNELAAFYWARLGSWYHRKMSHPEYAISSFKEGYRACPSHKGVHQGFADVLRSQQQWGELADLLEERSEQENVSDDEKIDIYLSLGELYETQLASTPKAIDAYEKVSLLPNGVDDGLSALQRLYRKSEKWAALTKVLQKRADMCEKSGRGDEATAIRHELAGLRSEKMGDLEGAISKYESALASQPGDVETLRALEQLYDKAGRNSDYLNTVGELTHHVEGEELTTLLRRYAAELEEESGYREKAISTWQRLVEQNDARDDDFRGLERLLNEDEQWSQLISAYELHANATKTPAKRADIYVKMATVFDEHLSDTAQAITTLNMAVMDVPNHREALAQLWDLNLRNESWAEALTAGAKLAGLDDGKLSAQRYVEAGKCAFVKLGDSKQATELFEKALNAKSDYVPAYEAFAEMYQSGNSWQNALRWLEDGAEVAKLRTQKSSLLCKAAGIAHSKLGDLDKALALYEEALASDPEHLEAGTWASDHYMAHGLIAKAAPLLEVVARCTPQDNAEEKAQLYCSLGHVYSELNESEKSKEAFLQATSSNPGSLDAKIGLLSEDAKIAVSEKGKNWQQVAQNYQAFLVKEKSSLTDSQLTHCWYALGEAKQHLGEKESAYNLFKKILDRDPGHEGTLKALSKLAIDKGDFNEAIQCQQSLCSNAIDDERFDLLINIGDTAHHQMKAYDVALESYLEALTERPNSRVVLHKLLDVYSAKKDWGQAVETLASIANAAADPKRRAKYHYAAGVICRDELKNPIKAIERFEAALEDNPSIQKAFTATANIHAQNGSWKELARAYRKQIKRAGEFANSDELKTWWGGLGDVCFDYLNDKESAIAAWEVAVKFDENDMHRQEQLADLYLEEGDASRGKAILAIQRLLRHSPDRVELYRTLSSLYVAEGEIDKAYCLAQALVFLGAATEQETQLYAAHRPKDFVASKRQLTEELWQQAVTDQREDKYVGSIFSSLMQPLAASSAQPSKAFGIQESKVDPAAPAAKLFQYACSVLDPAPKPRLALNQDTTDGVLVANTTEDGTIAPTMVMGESMSSSQSPGELAFQLGKRMAYLRPERYVVYSTGTAPKMEDAFYGALLAADVQVPGDHGGESKTVAATLKKNVSGAVLEQVGAVAGQMGLSAKNGVIAKWRVATDLTANRVGLILCNDLETAARIVATEPTKESPMSARERLQELLAYSVSEEYFSVRRHLGLSLTKR